MNNAKLEAELQKLDMSFVVQLMIIHLSQMASGAPDFYFHSGLNGISQPVTWQGIVYEPYPAEYTGFEISGEGSAPRPSLSLANLSGAMTGLAGNYNDLIGVRVTRVMTFRRYLDAVNFAEGNPEADPTVEFPRQVFEVGQKLAENPVFMQFSLNSPIDVEGVQLPRRQIVRNVCTWQYRGDGCFYNGPPVADEYDRITTDTTKDRCSKSLNGCRLRFGVNGILNYGSFPSLSLL